MAVSLTTEDKLEYQFYPVSGQQIQFRIKAPHDAHVALTTGPFENEPMWEVFIGGWKNSKSVIRKNRTKPDVTEVSTPDFLSANDMRGFWIRWSGGYLTVGREGEYEPFMSFVDPDPFEVAYFGVCTGWGASGEWLIEDPSQQQPRPSVSPSANYQMGGRFGGGTHWSDASSGTLPPGAVVDGEDEEPLYVGRDSHEGDVLRNKAKQKLYRRPKKISSDSSSTDAGDWKNILVKRKKKDVRKTRYRSSSASSIDRRNPSTSPEILKMEKNVLGSDTEPSNPLKRKRSKSVNEKDLRELDIQFTKIRVIDNSR